MRRSATGIALVEQGGDGLHAVDQEQEQGPPSGIRRRPPGGDLLRQPVDEPDRPERVLAADGRCRHAEGRRPRRPASPRRPPARGRGARRGRAGARLRRGRCAAGCCARSAGHRQRATSRPRRGRARGSAGPGRPGGRPGRSAAGRRPAGPAGARPRARTRVPGRGAGAATAGAAGESRSAAAWPASPAQSRARSLGSSGPFDGTAGVGTGGQTQRLAAGPASDPRGRRRGDAGDLQRGRWVRCRTAGRRGPAASTGRWAASGVPRTSRESASSVVRRQIRSVQLARISGETTPLGRWVASTRCTPRLRPRWAMPTSPGTKAGSSSARPANSSTTITSRASATSRGGPRCRPRGAPPGWPRAGSVPP